MTEVFHSHTLLLSRLGTAGPGHGAPPPYLGRPTDSITGAGLCTTLGTQAPTLLDCHGESGIQWHRSFLKAESRIEEINSRAGVLQLSWFVA